MADREKPLSKIVEDMERLGVIGSPSSTTEIVIDVLGTAASRKLVGELALFHYPQDDREHYALGQITEIQLRNIWHEDPTMRSLVRRHGRVDAVSARQDTHLGRMGISAVFAEGAGGGYEPSILGTVPSTGTSVYIVNDEVLEGILDRHRPQLFYLGQVYGSEPKMPLWFKHFDRGVNGAGEAYHLGLFGKTGAGKSVLAKMMVLAYARHREMALLVLDPQGEFAQDMRREASKAEEFRVPVGEVLRRLGREVQVIGVQQLVLDRWELFEEILAESVFFRDLTVPHGENRITACSVLAGDLEKKKKVKLRDVYSRESFDIAWQLLKDEQFQSKFYRSAPSRDRFNAAIEGADTDHFYGIWRSVGDLFREDRRGARKIESVLGGLLALDRRKRPVVVVDLSRQQAGKMSWNDEIQSLVIKRLLDGLTVAAERSFQERKSLNALVVIDEAHRLAPREVSAGGEAGRRVGKVLRDAARTTRKYGLGWMFISQTLASLDSEIVQQLRILFVGFGLGLGYEYDALRRLVGSKGTALDLYQSFRDPHSSFDTEHRQYSFMTTGPVSPLSSAGSPLFFNAFNSVDDFLRENCLDEGEGQRQDSPGDE